VHYDQNEGIIYSKYYGLSKAKAEVYCTKGLLTIDAPARLIFDVFYDVNCEKKWNISTVASMRIVEADGNVEMVKLFLFCERFFKQKEIVIATAPIG